MFDLDQAATLPEAYLVPMKARMLTHGGSLPRQRPVASRKIVRATLLVGWVLFWLSSLSFACCQAYAATAGKNSDGSSPEAAYYFEPQHFNRTDPIELDSHSPCEYVVSAGASAGPGGYLIDNSVSWEFVAPVRASPSLAVTPTVSTTLTPYEILPPVRLYLRELNLRL